MSDTHSGPGGALAQFWTLSVEEVCGRLGCGTSGLTAAEAASRLERFGPNRDAESRREGWPRAVLRRLLEPLSLILLSAGLVSVVTGDEVGGGIIVAILTLSIGLDTVQEGQAIRAAEVLRQSVALKAEVLRDGASLQIDVEQVVPGDLLRVRAGDIIPADALVLDAAAFTAGEAALTGEPYPVEKRSPTAGSKGGDTASLLYRGAVALSGEATALAVGTGRNTVFGAAAAALAGPQEASPFQRDLHAFGLTIARLTLGLVVVVLAARMIVGRDLLGSLLFAVALAVGLTPELLPMITTVTLSRGATRMARRKVIVKRLASIHDLGAMTVLCTDKTGTLTAAEIELNRSIAPDGAEDSRPVRLAAAAAELGGDRGALDEALRKSLPDSATGWSLKGRRSFDFSRRTGAILANGPEGGILILKGAPEQVLALCARTRTGACVQPIEAEMRAAVQARIRSLAGDGLRSIAVASRPWTKGAVELGAEDERDLIFEGLCVFADPPKATARSAIARLAKAGVSLKILSGDDPAVVQHVAGLVGQDAVTVLSGDEVAQLSDEALAVKIQTVDAFGRLAPDQKSRIVRALQAKGAIVGFLGDGINDAPALQAADVGLSVDGATGVAQAAADMILLAPDLAVVADGVEEGRRTFANILKYVRMGASSNFGNMLSMAAASFVLPFLPMLPTQILLNNLLYDLSEIGIPFDGVRADGTARPQVWDMDGLIRFAAVMGPLSSLFDALTFGTLYGLRATPEAFRTAWFMESMATQILVIFVIRTTARPWADRPGGALVASSMLALLAALILPFSPLGASFGFEPPPATTLAAIGAIVVAYLATAEMLKPFALRRDVRPCRPRARHSGRPGRR
ncbi:magnesium-translocating P-type ATPase [Alsobacter metallidurans]|nr:magnesium-translocating P-type ATPase [Alsobacter metallidurans]